MPALHSRADRQARLCLILHSLAPELGLVMDEDFVAGRLAAMAAERGLRPEVMRAEMVKTGQYRAFVDNLGIEIALDKLLRSVTVQSVSAEDWQARREARKAS
ncbi:MAG: hypothetical protein JNK53_08960 [Phycisphaerae bacterium]|nr:hypothetical protein [Phycisphaerae bacterium]